MWSQDGQFEGLPLCEECYAKEKFDRVIAACESALEWAEDQAKQDRPGVLPDWYKEMKAAAKAARGE